MNDTYFKIEFLNDGSWTALTEKYWNNKKGQFGYRYIEMENYEDALNRAKSLITSTGLARILATSVEIVETKIMSKEAGNTATKIAPKEAAKKEKKVKEPKVFILSLKDKEKWAKGAPQLKVILDHLAEKKIEKADVASLQGHLKVLVDTKKLVTRQDPYRVFAYYVPKMKEYGVLTSN